MLVLQTVDHPNIVCSDSPPVSTMFDIYVVVSFGCLSVGLITECFELRIKSNLAFELAVRGEPFELLT